MESMIVNVVLVKKKYPECKVILRVWRGKVAPEDAQEYIDYQHQVGPPGYRVVPGNLAVWMLARESESYCEIVMVTLWESWPAIEAFAGHPVDRAVYYDRDLAFLIDPPESVEHFDVVGHRWNPDRQYTKACLYFLELQVGDYTEKLVETLDLCSSDCSGVFFQGRESDCREIGLLVFQEARSGEQNETELQPIIASAIRWEGGFQVLHCEIRAWRGVESSD